MKAMRYRQVPRGLRPGIAICVLGITLFIGAFGLEIHAASGDRLVPGEEPQVSGTAPFHVVGVSDTGVDSAESVQCVVAAATDTRRIEIRIRENAFEAIRAGRQVRVVGEPATLECDRLVAVTTGPLVWMYPVAGSRILQFGYLGLALFGFAYAKRRHQSARLAASQADKGEDGALVDLRRLTSKVILDAAKVAAGFGAVVLGIAGVFAVGDRSIAALVFLVPACVLAVVALLAARRGAATRSNDGATSWQQRACYQAVLLTAKVPAGDLTDQCGATLQG